MEHSTKSAASTSNRRSTASCGNTNVEHDAPPSHIGDPTNHATPQQSATTTPNVARRKRKRGSLGPQRILSGLGAASIFATSVPVRCRSNFSQSSSTIGSVTTADHVTSATCAGDLKCRIPSAITVCTCASKSSRYVLKVFSINMRSLRH